MKLRESGDLPTKKGWFNNKMLVEDHCQLIGLHQDTTSHMRTFQSRNNPRHYANTNKSKNENIFGPPGVRAASIVTGTLRPLVATAESLPTSQ